MPKEIFYYQTTDGDLPFYRWLRTLDNQTKARVEARIKRLPADNLGDFKSVGSGILELRLHFGPGYRIYLVECADIWVLLLCGGDKSTQENDIRMAKFYWEDYKTRRLGE